MTTSAITKNDPMQRSKAEWAQSDVARQKILSTHQCIDRFKGLSQKLCSLILNAVCKWMKGQTIQKKQHFPKHLCTCGHGN